MAGHGLSDHKGCVNSYTIWSDVVDIIQVMNLMGWESAFLLGHSRGAMLATVLAGAFPSRVARLGLIEGALPHTSEDGLAPANLAESVKHLLKLVSRERRYYASEFLAVEARENGFIGVPHEDAAALAIRGVKQDHEGFYWANDPLLMAPSEVKLTKQQVAAFIERIAVPICLISGSKGMLKDNQDVQSWLVSASNVIHAELEGSHHLHMSEQAQQVASVLDGYFSEGQNKC